MIALICMVTGEHKNRVFKPFLLAGCCKEFANRHVGVANTLLNWQMFFLVNVLILGGNDERIVARYGEKCRHKGLFHLAHFRTIVLKKGLIPYSPVAIEVFIAPKSLIIVVVLSTIIVLKTYLFREC